MPSLLIATTNRGKLKEIARLLGTGIDLLTLSDVPGIPDVVEDGDTFEANARKKAVESASASGLLTLADDSGLEVDALDGSPGVHSARYSGDEATDATNNALLLKNLANVPDTDRTARFRCVIAVAQPSGQVATANGACEGLILHAERGSGGFGYDPLFLVPEQNLTFAELDPEAKNQVSHRGRALRAILPSLERLLSEK